MIPFSSFHTHTVYCDGKNTPEEMILAALAAGSAAIGFSGHSNTPFDPGYCMDAAREQAYRTDVLAMKEKYKDRIQVYLGLEQDYYSAPASRDYDYLIGSVHYVEKNGVYLSVDDTKELFCRGIENLYHGDVYRLCEDYFALVSNVKKKTDCTIVGHFDLISKFNEDGRLFDQTHPRYRRAALEALHTLLDQGALLEINTGAMARGYRTEPYPDSFLLEEMGKLGANAIITTDCHNAEYLCYGVEKAEKLAKKYGIRLLSY